MSLQAIQGVTATAAAVGSGISAEKMSRLQQEMDDGALNEPCTANENHDFGETSVELTDLSTAINSPGIDGE